jgi:hypothetical protein
MAIFKGQNTLLNGLYSYWSMDSNANDLWRNNDSTTINGASQNSGGILNNCYYFDGIDDYIELTDSENLFDLSTRSVSLWFKTPDWSYSNDLGMIVTQASEDLSYGGIAIYWNSSNLRLVIGRDPNALNYSRSLLSTNEWYHVVITSEFDVINKYYINGELKNTTYSNRSGGSASHKNTNFTIGADRLVTRRHPKMYFDEFGFWNRILSETEISLLYNMYNQSQGLSSFSYIPKFARSNLKKDILSYWKFEESSGDAIDSIGIYSGTSNNITYQAEGIIDKCYSFSKTSNSYIEVSNPSDFEIGTENWTYSLWFNTDTTITATDTTWLGLLTSTNSGYSNYFFARMETGGLIRFTAADGTNPMCLIFSQNGFNDGEWHHLCVSYMSDDYEWRMYIDGNLEGISTNINSAINNTQEFRIGCIYGTISDSDPRDYFDGLIDEVSVWKKTLSHEDIRLLYNYGQARSLDTFKQAPKKIGYGLLTDLISYWSFDENANDLHRDNDGSINGATHTNGFYDKGYYFDGTDDYITGDDFLNNETKGTISCWFKTDNITSNGVLFYHGDSAVGSTNACLFLYVRSSTGDVSIRMRRNGGGGYQQATTNSFNDNEWHHCVVSYDGEGVSGSYKCYIDGVEENFPVVDSDESIGWVKESSDTQVHTEYRFGSWNRVFGDGLLFKGDIDEFGIWRKVLTETEIKYLYNKGQGITYHNLRY